MPSKARVRPPLHHAEYINPDQPVTKDVAAARHVFVSTVQRLVPEFFTELKSRVYPKFARYARVAQQRSRTEHRGPGYWELGWQLDTWEKLSGPNRFRPVLQRWAGVFHCGNEDWILTGALEVLSSWFTFPAWLEAVDVNRFCVPYAGLVLLDFEPLSFTDMGWSPQFEMPWSEYRAQTIKKFVTALDAYGHRVRREIEARGGIRARRTFSHDDLEWFVLYQIRGLSSVDIRNTVARTTSDPSSILRGVKTAARLLGWKTLRTKARPHLRLGK